MKNKIKKIVNCSIGSMITTIVILLGSFLVMLFSSSEDGIRKTFFNTLFFESTTKSDGVVDMHFGLTENYIPILLTIFIIFIFYYSISISYELLNNYRNNIIEERKFDEKE